MKCQLCKRLLAYGGACNTLYVIIGVAAPLRKSGLFLHVLALELPLS